MSRDSGAGVWRLRAVELAILRALEVDAKADGLPLRFAATSDLAQRRNGLVTVMAVWGSGDEALQGWELLGLRLRVADLGRQTNCGVRVVTGSRAEALDPETTAERLALLATVFPDEVRANPALPILRVTHPGLFDDLPL